MCVCLPAIAVVMGGQIGAFDINDTTDRAYQDGNDITDGQEATEIAEVLKEEAVDDDQGAVQRILGVFGIDYNQTE